MRKKTAYQSEWLQIIIIFDGSERLRNTSIFVHVLYRGYRAVYNRHMTDGDGWVKPSAGLPGKPADQNCVCELL